MAGEGMALALMALHTDPESWIVQHTGLLTALDSCFALYKAMAMATATTTGLLMATATTTGLAMAMATAMGNETAIYCHCDFQKCVRLHIIWIMDIVLNL